MLPWKTHGNLGGILRVFGQLIYFVGDDKRQDVERAADVYHKVLEVVPVTNSKKKKSSV